VHQGTLWPSQQREQEQEQEREKRWQRLPERCRQEVVSLFVRLGIRAQQANETTEEEHREET